MRTEQPKMIYLKDYQAPEYLIDETHLTFELFEDHSLVHAQLVMRRNPERGPGLPPLVLDGQQLELLSVTLADQELSAAQYQLTENHLTLQPTSTTFTVDTSVRIHPETNTALEGRRLPQDHLLPRPPGRDEHVHHHGGRRAAQLPGAAVQRQPDCLGSRRRRPALGDLGRPVQEAGLPVRAGGR
jgi:hypothetical protein